MKSTFVIETPRIPRGRATTIKIHSIPPPSFAPRLIPFISPPRDSGESVCVCVCTPRERITSTVEMARWRGKKERVEGTRRTGGDVFSDRVVLYHRKIGIEATPVLKRACTAPRRY